MVEDSQSLAKGLETNIILQINVYWLWKATDRSKEECNESILTSWNKETLVDI